MKTRDFLSALSLAALVLSGCATSRSRVAGSPAARQYLELRTYTTKSAEQQQRIASYWRDAGIPAYRRLGAGPIGVFTEVTDTPTNHIYVLIPHNSPDELVTDHERLAADQAYQVAGSGYLDATAKSAPYARYDTTLCAAFDAMKTLDVPVPPQDGAPRIFELRIYESPSDGKGENKVVMFNNGEIPLMKEVGLAPIFFGQAITGSQMPNLVYMVSGENKAEHDKHWKAFFDAPVWKKLSGDPQYKDNVSKVVNVFLKRVPGSQI